ncbi:MAG: 2-succinyl-5-enolpyruvyl-6-hydroxy-3-cyclohexene-1-carboxylic-acid synthase [Calditrichia bacterium]
MKNSFENINMVWGYLIIEELIRNGARYFCLSPGSRSAPLAIAIARHEQVRSLVCYDERGAAYHALGYARATGTPAVVITTSGTAVANCLPAVVEASRDHIPLIILSADRPPELRETAANQTIRQPGIFGDYVRWQFDLPCPQDSIPPAMVLTTVDQLFYRSVYPPPGPVHLNCMFREPLAPIAEPYSADYLSSLGGCRENPDPYTVYRKPECRADEETIRQILDKLNSAVRGILVVGHLKSEREKEAVAQLARQLGWPLFADIRSGLRLESDEIPLVPYFNHLFECEAGKRLIQPEVVLHLGGPLTSKRFLQFLEADTACEYLQVADHPERHDPAHRANFRVTSDLSLFCDQLTPRLNPPKDKNWVQNLVQLSAEIGEVFEARLLKTEKISEPAVARMISRLIPRDSALFLASSMPVREMDWFAAPGTGKPPIAANRGSSGIDGTIASAAGFAAGLQKPLTLLIGDQACLHDLNSFSLLKFLNQPVVVVLINNQGGGIFHFLPVADYPEVFESFFAAPHEYTFRATAEQFGLSYYHPATLQEFQTAYNTALQNAGSSLIELRTDRQENVVLHRQIWEEIRKRFSR